MLKTGPNMRIVICHSPRNALANKSDDQSKETVEERERADQRESHVLRATNGLIRDQIKDREGESLIQGVAPGGGIRCLSIHCQSSVAAARIRNQLAEKGAVLKGSKDGVRWKRK